MLEVGECGYKPLPFGLGHSSPYREHIAHGSFKYVLCAVHIRIDLIAAIRADEDALRRSFSSH